MATARRLILVAALGLMLAVPVTAHAADTTVSIAKGPFFDPGDVTVTVGGSITWVNDDDFTHDAAAIDGTWKTPTLGTGEKATVTFDTTGSYEYLCTLHPIMRGTVTVLPAPPDTSTAPARTGDSQGGPTALVLVVAGMLGAVVAARRFGRTSTY